MHHPTKHRPQHSYQQQYSIAVSKDWIGKHAFTHGELACNAWNNYFEQRS
jgi:hypothetical protein